MATVASHKHLFTYYQQDGNDNHKYYQEFCTHVKTLETYGRIGAIVITPTFLTGKLKDLAVAVTISSATNPTDPKCLLAIKQCHDKFLGCLMLSGANKDGYVALKSDLNNQYDFKKDLYPKSPNQCLSLLNCCLEAPACSPHHHTPAPVPIKQEKEALVLAPDKKNPSKPKDDGSKSSSSSSSLTPKPQITNVCCKACGKLGHTLSVCPNTKPPPVQIHAMSADGDASDASDEESVVILAQFDKYINVDLVVLLAQEEELQTINFNLVLLDSQSTIDLFTNPAHVQNIHPAKKPIQVHCNKGTMATTKEADLGNTPVYFDSCGIANVLSLYCLGKKFQVAYDSRDCGCVFQVHTKMGIVEFKPTPKGLHPLNLKANPKAAFLLVNNADLYIPEPEHQLHFGRTMMVSHTSKLKAQVQPAIS